MDLTHLHLILNHVPVIGVIFGFLILSYAMMKKNQDLIQVSLAIFVTTALVAVAVYFTGEPAEETVEHLAGVTESSIERHEEAALFALLGASALGIIALGGLLAFKWLKAKTKMLAAIALVGSLIVSGLMAWTATLGGQIRHSEIRSAAASSYENTSKEAQKNAERNDEHKREKDER